MRCSSRPGWRSHLGGNKIASGAGLLTAIHRQPAILFQIDEFGMFLSAAADRRRSPRHITDILDNMTELYTSAGGIFLGAEYANRDGQNERRDINQPCLCVYGTTTPLHFWNALQGSNVLDGSLARFIILPTDNDYPDENADAGLRTTPRSLLDELKRVSAGGGRRRKGNLVGKTSGLETAVDAMVVPMHPDAREAFRTVSNEITRRAARSAWHSLYLDSCPHRRERTEARDDRRRRARPGNAGDHNGRRRMVDWVRSALRQSHHGIAVERHVADNEVERNHKRVLELIRNGGADGLSKNELSRRTQFVERRQREEIIHALVEAALIESFIRRTPTKSAEAYRVRPISR